MSLRAVFKGILFPQIKFCAVSIFLFWGIRFVLLEIMQLITVSRVIPLFLIGAMLVIYILMYFMYIKKHFINRVKLTAPNNLELQISNANGASLVFFVISIFCFIVGNPKNLWVISLSGYVFLFNSIITYAFSILFLNPLTSDIIYSRFIKGSLRSGEVEYVLKNIKEYKIEIEKFEENDLKLLKTHAASVENNYKLNYRITLFLSLFSAVFALVMKDKNPPVSEVIAIVVFMGILFFVIAYMYKSAAYVTLSKELIDIVLAEKIKERERKESIFKRLSRWD